MKKILVFVVTIILSIFVGMGGMYLLMHYFPNNFGDSSTKVVKNINVTDDGISSGVDAIYDSVVLIENYKNNTLAGIGSGFVYSKEGYIITNHHVIENATEVKVLLTNGQTISASIIGSDEYADIGVIKIDSKNVIGVAKIGSSEKSKVGDTVFTIGSPVGTEYLGTVTRGILSGKDRMVEVSIKNSTSNDWIMNVMQTDAAINPGNSGGPLCNVSGEVIGVNSMKIVKNEIEGIGFSIPIEIATDYANRIIKGEKIDRAYLGVSMTDISTSPYYLLREGIKIDSSITSGVVVVSVEKDSPSDKAGLKKGDIITKIGDYKVNNVAELRYYLFKYKPNDKIQIVINREKSEKTLKITLGVSK